jgi:hypothetical protein
MNNFLVDEEEYEYSHTTDTLRYSTNDLDEIAQNYIQEEESSFVLNEAMKRIEQAKLYEALLKHDLFGEGSARPEIIDAVKTEIKTFILSRLERLLGMKPEETATQAQRADLPFSDEEVDALKALASRVLNTSKPAEQKAATPTIKPMTAQQDIQHKTTVVNTISVPKQAYKTPRQQQPVQSAQPKQRKRRQSESVSKEGIDYAQVVDPTRKPLKMPSQSEIDAMNARQAESNSGSSGISGLGANTTATLLNHFQNLNKNVKE